MDLFRSAVILSGGKSKRMGCNKALIKLNEKPIIEIILEQLNTVFPDVIVITNEPEQYLNINARIVQDKIKNVGPLGGLHSGLIASQSKYAFVIACDMPFVSMNYIRYMRKIVIRNLPNAVVSYKQDFIEPFHAFYSKCIIKDIEKNVNEGLYSIYDTIRGKKIYRINQKIVKQFSPYYKIFTNINNKNDLKKII